MPTSKVTRVRNDGFSKIMARVLPLSAPEKMLGLAFTWQATCRKCRICWGVKSRIERKSWGTMLPPCSDQSRPARFGEMLQHLCDCRSAQLLNFVTYPHAWLIEPYGLRQV